MNERQGRRAKGTSAKLEPLVTQVSEQTQGTQDDSSSRQQSESTGTERLITERSGSTVVIAGVMEGKVTELVLVAKGGREP